MKRVMLGVLFYVIVVLNIQSLYASAPEGVAQTPSGTLAGDYIQALHARIDAQHIAGTSERVVRVADYGAQGDGIADDASAIQQALDALQNGDTLSLDSGKVYALGNGAWNGLQLSGRSNVLIAGNGATLKLVSPVTTNYNPGANYSYVTVFLAQCNGCEINNIIFDLGPIPTGAVGVHDTSNAVFRNMIAHGGTGQYQFWSTKGVGNIWLSNYSDRITQPSVNTWGYYIGNTNVGLEDQQTIFAGNAAYRERWDGFVMMIKDATIVGNTGIDNPWSTMISPGWIQNASRNQVVIGNYLKGGLNHQYQVDFNLDGSYLDGLVLFGNWMNGAGSGANSTGAYFPQLHNAWALANKITNANYIGFQVTGYAQNIVIESNDVEDTGNTPSYGIKISPFGGYLIDNVQIQSNNFRNAAYGIGTGSDGENGGTRDNIYIADNYVIGGSQSSGSLDGGITITGWRDTPAPDPDGSLSALAALAQRLPVGTLRSEVEDIVALVTTFRSADVGLSMAVMPNSVTIGDNLTYTATVNNTGPSTAHGVVLSDALPAGLTYVTAVPSQGICTNTTGTVTCSLGDMANGASASVTITVQTMASGTIINTMTVSGSETDLSASNNTASVSVTINPATDLAISMTGTPNPVFAGQPLTYFLAITNNGPSTATGVTLNDYLPSGMSVTAPPTASQGKCTSGQTSVTCALGTLASGSTATVSIVVQQSATGTFANLASVSGNETDPNPGNNDTSVMTTVDPAADLSITNTGTPTTVYVNDTITYAVTVTNNGPSTASGPGFTDTLGSGLSFISVTPSTGCTPGQTVTCALGNLAKGSSATVNITAKVGIPGTLTNTASVTSIDFDPLGTYNSASTTTTVNPTADLALTLTGTPNPVYLGSTETYTITVTNLGPSPATNISVTGTLPSCSFPSLAANTSTSCTRTATAPSMSSLSQTLSVTATELDRNPANNSASLTTPVIAPDLIPTAMSATKSGSKVYVSDTVKNQGNGSAGPFTVSYYLSTNTTYESTDLLLVSASGGSMPCTRSVSSLAPGATSSVSNKICYKPGTAVTGTKYYVLVVDDAAKQVIESNVINNARATTGTVRW